MIKCPGFSSRVVKIRPKLVTINRPSDADNSLLQLSNVSTPCSVFIIEIFCETNQLFAGALRLDRFAPPVVGLQAGQHLAGDLCPDELLGVVEAGLSFVDNFDCVCWKKKELYKKSNSGTYNFLFIYIDNFVLFAIMFEIEMAPVYSIFKHFSTNNRNLKRKK